MVKRLFAPGNPHLAHAAYDRYFPHHVLHDGLFNGSLALVRDRTSQLADHWRQRRHIGGVGHHPVLQIALRLIKTIPVIQDHLPLPSFLKCSIFSSTRWRTTSKASFCDFVAISASSRMLTSAFSKPSFATSN
jgi:hypothetical protein